jgi:hypothetical protein
LPASVRSTVLIDFSCVPAPWPLRLVDTALSAVRVYRGAVALWQKRADDVSSGIE